MSGNLQTISDFFTNVSANTDVDQAVFASAWLYKIATIVVSVVGMYGAAVFIMRIAVDIILIALRGTGVADKLGKFGTAGGQKSDSYNSVGGYIKDCVPEIVMTVVLLVFLITGWIFNLIALTITAIGTLINKLSGMDVLGAISSESAKAFLEQYPRRPNSALKNEYDRQISSAQNNYKTLQSMSTLSSDDPKFKSAVQRYGVAMAKAELLGKHLKDGGAETSMKLGSGYFSKHLRVNDDGTSYCNSAYLKEAEDVLEKYQVGVKCGTAE